MRTSQRLFLALASMALIDGAYSQTSADPSPKVEKDCIDLSPQARQECLKVAKQMDRSATTSHQPATKPDSGNSPSPNTVQHSSPVMQTPQEIKEDQQARKAAESAAKKKANPDSKQPAQAPR
jgi:hypothetical protein